MKVKIIISSILILFTYITGYTQGYTYTIGTKNIDEIGLNITSLSTIPHIYFLARNDDANGNAIGNNVYQIDKKTGKILWIKSFKGNDGGNIDVELIEMINDTTICVIGGIDSHPYLETFNHKGETKFISTFPEMTGYIKSITILKNNILLLLIQCANSKVCNPGTNAIVKFDYAIGKQVGIQQFNDKIVMGGGGNEQNYYVSLRTGKHKKVTIDKYSSVNLSFVGNMPFENSSFVNRKFRRKNAVLTSFEISNKGDKAILCFRYPKINYHRTFSSLIDLSNGKTIVDCKALSYELREGAFVNDSIVVFYGSKRSGKWGGTLTKKTSFRVLNCAKSKNSSQNYYFNCTPAFDTKTPNNRNFCPDDNLFYGFWFDVKDSSYYFTGYSRGMGNYGSPDILVVKADKNLNVGTFESDYQNYLSDLRKNIIREYRRKLMKEIVIGTLAGVATSPMGIYNITGGDLALTQAITNSSDQLVTVIDKNHDYSEEYNLHKMAANEEIKLVQKIDQENKSNNANTSTSAATGATKQGSFTKPVTGNEYNGKYKTFVYAIINNVYGGNYTTVPTIPICDEHLDAYHYAMIMNAYAIVESINTGFASDVPAFEADIKKQIDNANAIRVPAGSSNIPGTGPLKKCCTCNDIPYPYPSN